MRIAIIVLALVMFSASAGAKELEIRCTANCQAEFERFSEAAVALIDYKAMGPAEATGLTGVGVGIVASYMPVDTAEWQAVTGERFDGVGLIGAQVTKGLPLNLDVGVFYTYVPETDVKVYGGEVRYAILEGGTATPALALRGSYVTVDGISSFDLNSKAVDLSLSKGFTILTPYIGVGYVFGEAEPDPTPTGPTKVEVEEPKVFVGARISLGLIEFTPQVDRVGDETLYNLRVGFSI